MEKIESYIQAHDRRHRLYYEAWKAKRPRAVLIFVHGLNEHSGRYTNPIKYFSKKNYTLYLFDQRGHGRSDGLRSFVAHFDTYLKDLHEFCDFVSKEEKGRKLFMVGHSMGGQIVLNYAGFYKNSLNGLITSSANIEMAVKIPWYKRFFVFLLASFFPRFHLPRQFDPKWISRDRAVVLAYKKDPLVFKKITLKLAVEMAKNQEKLIGLAGKIRLPSLIMHSGDDHICSVEGSKKFYRNLASTDKTLKIFDGYYHELFNEIGKEKVFRGMEEWLKRHL